MVKVSSGPSLLWKFTSTYHDSSALCSWKWMPSLFKTNNEFFAIYSAILFSFLSLSLPSSSSSLLLLMCFLFSFRSLGLQQSIVRLFPNSNLTHSDVASPSLRVTGKNRTFILFQFPHFVSFVLLPIYFPAFPSFLLACFFYFSFSPFVRCACTK